MKIGIFGLGVFGMQLANQLLQSDFEVAGTVRKEEKLTALKSSGISVSLLHLEADKKTSIDADMLSSDVFIFNFTPSGLGGFFLEKHREICALLPAEARVIFISSTSVYASNEGLVSENSELNKTHILTQTENFLCEQLGNRLTVIRPAGLYGEGRSPAPYLSGRQNLENANQVVNLIHLIDLIRFTEYVIQTELWGNTYNVCASEHPSREICYTLFCEQLGLGKPHFLEDTSKMKGKFVSNQKSLETGFHYLKNDPLFFEVE